MKKNIIIIILLCFAVCCFLYVGFSCLDKKQSEKEYENLITEVVVEQEETDDFFENEDEKEIEKTEKTNAASSLSRGKNVASSFKVDWDSLLGKNKDVVGWIRMSSGANYPILQGETNNTYLRTNIYGKSSVSGCIFINAGNSSDFSDFNTIVYGHNMRNGTMFGNNDYYKSKTYAKGHPYVYIYTPAGTLTYQIFAAATVADGTFPYNIQIDSLESRKAYLEEVKNIASYYLDDSVSEDDSILMLSTCTGIGDKRFVIWAKRKTLE